MQFERTEIEDVILVKPKVLGDRRGFFLESYRQSKFAEAGIATDFVQDNISSSQRNTVRGLHYQIDQPQDKLVMVMKGEILDVAVDLRKDSDTFGKSVTRRLSGENHYQLFIPKGFAHGFSVLSDQALVYYKCTDYYHPEGERGLLWDDPQLEIDWKIDSPIPSEKDQNQPKLNQIPDKDLFTNL